MVPTVSLLGKGRGHTGTWGHRASVGRGRSERARSTATWYRMRGWSPLSGSGVIAVSYLLKTTPLFLGR